MTEPVTGENGASWQTSGPGWSAPITDPPADHDENVPDRIDATRAGRWGVHQMFKGEPTGGGTVGMGWATEQEAREQNPPYEGFGGSYTYEPFERAL